MEIENETQPITKPQKWNTGRLTIYGAFAGLAYAVWGHAPDWGVEPLSSTLGTLTGGTVGGAALVAIVSGIRNLFVR